MKLREALRRAEAEAPRLESWDGVEEPFRSDPKARSAFEAWRRLQACTPLPDSPGFLDHFDAERKALAELVKLAEAALGPRSAALAEGLRQRLREAQLQEDSFVWKRAWEHHWVRLVCEAWGLSP
jgi:hypothetical protein